MENNEEYIGELLDKYGNTVLRLAYTYLKNQADAEDVLQEIFLTIVEKHPTFNDKNHERFWIVRSTINACKNKLGSFWNRYKTNIDDAKEIAVCDNYNTDSAVLDAVMSLQEKYRIAVYMFYYEEYSTTKIAGLIGKNEATVRSLLCRARKQLKDILKEDYDFEREI